MVELRESPVIATRTLRSEDENLQVIVTLHAPQPDSHGDWECSFAIEGTSDHIVDSAFGIDAMQSLIQALDGIRCALESMPNVFSWAGEVGDAGFPRFIPTFFGPEFTSHVGKIIDTEVNKFAEEAEVSYKDFHKQ